MDYFKKSDMEEALKAIDCMIDRSKKAQVKLAEGTSQYTLLKNRIKALQITSSLIVKELADSDRIQTGYAKEEMKKAVAPIASLISKSEKAQRKLTPGLWQYTMLDNNLKALHIALTLLEKALALSRGDDVLDSGPFYHGTKADLKPGDLLEAGYSSNYGERKKANYVYLTATLDAATWGAELEAGDGPGRIYRVEPLGPIENDPNLTDKKFPGNPTKSYRTKQPLRVLGEVLDWEGHPPEILQNMLKHLAELKRQGIEAIND